MSKNTRCYLVMAAIALAEVTFGAMAAYILGAYVHGLAAVAVVALIGFGAALDLETGIAAGIATVLAFLLAPWPVTLVIPGSMVGFMLIFRSTALAEWLYPPLGRPFEADDEGQAPP